MRMWATSARKTSAPKYPHALAFLFLLVFLDLCPANMSAEARMSKPKIDGVIVITDLSIHVCEPVDPARDAYRLE